MKFRKILLSLLFAVSLYSCKKKAAPLYVTTNAAYAIDAFTALGGGIITGEGVSEKGVCWSTQPKPTVENNKTSEGAGEVKFTSRLTGLSPSTTYYIRAYAINAAGVAYGNELTFTSVSYTFGQLTDQEGNQYKTVIIGGVEWMAENLKVTKYRNGDLIQNITDDNLWLLTSSGARCSYQNSTTNLNIYGILYNWYAISDSRQIAPLGWHIPSSDEFSQLVDILGGLSFASRKLCSAGIYWPNNSNATNEVGFSALPSGCRLNGTFSGINVVADFWTTSAANTQGCDFAMDELNSSFDFDDFASGFSIRCVKD